MSKKRKTNEEKTKTKTKRERTDSFTYIVENDVPRDLSPYSRHNRQKT